MLDIFSDLDIAKRIIRRALRKKGISPSLFTIKEFNRAGNILLEHKLGPKMIRAERYNIKRRKEPVSCT